MYHEFLDVANEIDVFEMLFLVDNKNRVQWIKISISFFEIEYFNSHPIFIILEKLHYSQNDISSI